jgi:dTMP kinase
MNGFPGKFIVIDGTDGSGKTTQLRLLKNRLEGEGYSVQVADFPQYNSKSAGLVEEYLSGKYGHAEEVDAYKASIFYAVDRYDASFKIREWLQDGQIVLANRYTSANLGHQGCKIANPLERRVFFNWLYELEYKIFGIPQPDLSIILHVEAAIAQKLVRDRSREDWNGKTTDIHENDLNHLQKAEKVYLEIAESFPDFRLINCTKHQELLSREEIALLIWLAVRPVIGQNLKRANNFQAIGQIIGSNQQIVDNREIIFDRYKNSGSSAATSAQPAKPNQSAALSQKLAVERINPSAKLPQKAHVNDAGYDLYANDYYSLPPYGQALVATGIKLAIPAGQVGLIWDKSGLASNGLTTMGGVIDSNYRGEIKVVVKNLSEDDFNIVPGQKIAQILIQQILDLTISEEQLDNQTEREARGFGSSGQF